MGRRSRGTTSQRAGSWLLELEAQAAARHRPPQRLRARRARLDRTGGGRGPFLRVLVVECRARGQRRPREWDRLPPRRARRAPRGRRLSSHPRRRCCTRCRRTMAPSPERSCQMGATPRSSAPDRRSRSSSARDGCGTRRRTWLRSRRLRHGLAVARGARGRDAECLPASRYLTGRSSVSGGCRRRICAAGWRRASIYAMPARYEPFGLSILEAGLSGCALVLGDIPSLREHWDGAAAFVAPDDREALRSAIEGLIDSPARRAELGRRARDARPGVHGRPDGGCLPAPVRRVAVPFGRPARWRFRRARRSLLPLARLRLESRQRALPARRRVGPDRPRSHGPRVRAARRVERREPHRAARRGGDCGLRTSLPGAGRDQHPLRPPRPGPGCGARRCRPRPRARVERSRARRRRLVRTADRRVRTCCSSTTRTTAR